MHALVELEAHVETQPLRELDIGESDEKAGSIGSYAVRMKPRASYLSLVSRFTNRNAMRLALRCRRH